VWGVWQSGQLFLTIGTPVTREALAADAAVTVHLDSGTEVVIVEGRASGPSDDAEILQKYDAKYDWSYDLSQFGSLTRISPETVLAWRTTGWAGREAFSSQGAGSSPDDPPPWSGFRPGGGSPSASTVRMQRP
jgi:hypothetical protein